MKPKQITVGMLSLLFLATLAVDASAREPKAKVAETAARSDVVSMNFNDQPIQEVVNALSRTHQVNIVLGKGVTGNISVNLYNVSLQHALRTIADSAGVALEQRNEDYYLVDRKEVGQDFAYGSTMVKSFKVQYSNPKQVSDIVTKYLSRYGKLTMMEDRKMLVVEDTPEFIGRIERILQEIDAEPKQIMIEAKILEIRLNGTETFGVDWSGIFNRKNTAGGTSAFGTQGIATRGIPGLFFNYVNNNISLYLDALNTKGRVHTLSTPKLLTLDNQEASTKIGDNIGYLTTTTVNQITTSSVSFLETGVILKVTPSVDQRGRILMKIHPEVSSGSISTSAGNSIPSKKTTEVTTQLLVEDGQPILIGGLIKKSSSLSRSGVPVLGDVPMFGRLFSSTDENSDTSETVVIITARVVKNPLDNMPADTAQKLNLSQQTFLKQSQELESLLQSPTQSTQEADDTYMIKPFKQ